MSRHAKLSSGESSLSAGSSRGLESGNVVPSAEGGHSLRCEAAVFLSSPSTSSAASSMSADIATPRLQITSTAESVVLRPVSPDGARFAADVSSSAKPLERGSLDLDKSLRDVVADNLILNRIPTDGRGLDTRAESFLGCSGAGIKVQFQNHDVGSAEEPPDFIVRKDGTVELLSQSVLEGKATIVVQVEREFGRLKPADAQEAALDELTRYLSGRLRAEHPELAKQVRLDDPQRLISDDTRKDFAPPLPELEYLPEPTRRQIEDLSRFRGGGGGSMPRRDADEYFPRRDVPREANESERLAAMKDVVAGFAGRDDKNPYEQVQKRERGMAIGRYGFTYNMFADWLGSLDLEAMEELERKGKLPKGTCSRLRKMKDSVYANKKDPAAKLDPFLDKLRDARSPSEFTAGELKQNFPKEVQELAASATIGKLALQTLNTDGSIDTGKIALAMHLGRLPDQSDLVRPEYRAMMETARQSYQIAERRQMSPDSSGPIDWTDVNGRTLASARNAVGHVMWRDFASVVEGGRLGCAASVSEVLEQTGIRGIKSALVTDFASQAMRRGYERLPLSQGRPGDIVYGVEPGGGGGGGSAHIGVIGAGGAVYHNRSRSGRWSEDRLASVFNQGRFGRNLWVLRAPQA